jgi:hypothetical protein
MKIEIKLVQDTLNYLSTCPWAQSNELIVRWNEALKQEKEDDGNIEDKS